MEFLMVMMFFIAGLYLWLKPYKKGVVIGFSAAGVAILVFMMAWVNKFTILPMGNF